MVTAFGMARRIRRVVRLRQMLRDWRNKARLSPSDVPAGHVAIYAGGCGGTCRRFIVRVTYLNHPVFVKLLSEAEEEYGFGHDGPLTIPCDESAFEDAMRTVSCSREMDTIGCGRAEEFRPLLIGLVQAPVW